MPPTLPTPQIDQRKYAFLTAEQKAQGQTPVAPKTDVEMISSQTGLDLLRDATKKEQALTPAINTPQQETPTTKQGTSITPPSTTEVRQPTKGQYSFDEAYQLVGNDFTDVQQMDDGRYNLGQSALSRIGVNTTKSPEQIALDQAKTQVEADQVRLRTFESDLQNDPNLLSMLGSISTQWDQRIKQQEEANKYRTGAISTAMTRLGSRYTAGAAGPSAGIISAEERAGMQRVEGLLADKNAALIDARNAYATRKWDQYAKLVTLSDNKFKEAQVALKELNAKTKEETKKREDEKLQASRDQQIVSLISNGITDPAAIMTTLNAQGGNYRFDEVNKIAKEFQLADETARGIVGEWMSATKNDPSLQGVGLMDYIHMKNPQTAQDIMYKNLQIQKLQKEMSGSPGSIIGSDEKIVLQQADAQKMNKEIASSEAYKAIVKGKDALSYVNDFADKYSKVGLETLPLKDKGELRTKYNAATLNLKEFFNLGVLNGPDLSVIQGILPDPTTGFLKKIRGRASATTAGIETVKGMIEKTLDDRYSSIAIQYSDYSPQSVTSIENVNRMYIEQKAALNPAVAKLVNENPDLSSSEIIQLIR